MLHNEIISITFEKTVIFNTAINYNRNMLNIF